MILLHFPAVGMLRLTACTMHERMSPQIMGVLEHFKKEGHNPLAPGFRLKPIFEELPSDTDSKTGYKTIK